LITNIETVMTSSPVIPVIIINDPGHAIPLATALYQGGLHVLEITLRTPHGLGAIKTISEQIPDAIVGAGTVTTAEHISAVLEVGGQFMVSPGITDTLIEAAMRQEVILLPGIATPSEAMKLIDYGIHHMKFFPAEAAGGIPMLKSMRGPFPQLSFCPTGGLTPASAKDYLALPNVTCVGGSWMVPQNLIEAGDWDAIELLAREAAASY
jgi:2-dehydro-3-deoxyphosphogluconate aldolase / (4S)-4-hydroxy-2-oxoglutarate aldolase